MGNTEEIKGLQKYEKSPIIIYVNLDLKNILNTISTHKHKKIVGLAILVVFVCLFFFYLGIKTPETTPDNPKPRSFPERMSQGFSDWKESIDFKRKPTVPTNPESTSAIKTYSAKEITALSMLYIDNQKRPDGFYNYFSHYETLCKNPSDPKTCPNEGRNFFEPTNLWTILARTAYYRDFSKDPKDLEKAKADATVLMDYCNTYPKSCFAALTAFAELNTQIKNPGLSLFLQKEGDLLLNDDPSNIMQYDIEVREFIRLYDVLKDPRYGDEAKKRLDRAKIISASYEKDVGIDQSRCYVVLAETDLGITTNDQSLINNALAFFRDNKETTVQPQLTLIQPCIEAALLLAKKTNDPQITKKADTLLTTYIEDRWDGPVLKRRFEDGGFLMLPRGTSTNTTDTGYMIYLLGFFPNKTYTFHP